GDRADALLRLAEAQLALARDLLTRHQLRLGGAALRRGDPLVGLLELASGRGQLALDRGAFANQLLLARAELLARLLVGGRARSGDLARAPRIGLLAGGLQLLGEPLLMRRGQPGLSPLHLGAHVCLRGALALLAEGVGLTAQPGGGGGARFDRGARRGRLGLARAVLRGLRQALRLGQRLRLLRAGGVQLLLQRADAFLGLRLALCAGGCDRLLAVPGGLLASLGQLLLAALLLLGAHALLGLAAGLRG